VIKSFADAETETLWLTGRSPRIPTSVCKTALKKLRIQHWARNLTDRKAPPGNRLELLRGERSGQHSIRINDQFRICFVWAEGDAYEVEIVDYH
jgi:proteic killer suppression protein